MNDETHAEPVQIPLQLLDPQAVVPTYARDGDAGADLRALTGLTLGPGERALVDTGVAMAIPAGHVGLVHPRSGLAAKHGITVLNAPGTVDSGYRGEIKVCLLNTDRTEAYTVAAGERIAQLVIQRVETAAFDTVDGLPDSDRGHGGFGSSGTH